MAISSIFEQARQTPDKIAVVYNGASYSYADFARIIEITRQYLARQDLPLGAVAVMDVHHLLDEWIIGFALRSLGLTTIATRPGGGVEELGIRNIGCVVRVEPRIDARRRTLRAHSHGD